ncbi:MAG: DUF429 domain-containing protein [Methanoregula sp.]|nr:DUF429 domain-containing protein [Methanoregula sp.]
MISNTFQFIPKFGKKTETALWKKEIFTWEDLRQSLPELYRDEKKQQQIRDHLCKAGEALAHYDGEFFARYLPPAEHWRLYRKFREKTVFLDIETTGLSPYYDTITVIGTHDGSGTKIFMRDVNLDDICKYLAQFPVIVTFNGKLFDLPFMRKFFPEIALPPVHIDLRFLLRSIGYSGPLKKIEQDLGIVRDTQIQGIDGRYAVVLWNRFVRGDDTALRDLILYNITDTINLRSLMDLCYVKKIEQEILPHLDRENTRMALPGPEEWGSPGLFFSDPGSKGRKNEISVIRSGRELQVFQNDEPLLSVGPGKISRPGITVFRLLDRITSQYAPIPGRGVVSVGIDLTGSGERASGICTLKGDNAFLDLLHTDNEIIDTVRHANPDVIAIDASLGLPKGRCCTEESCDCRKYGIMRECERELKRRGVNVYPTLIPSLQQLTKRGIRLAKTLRALGFTVIESYPGATQDILGFPRKRVHLTELSIDLITLGITPHTIRKTVTHDEIDALTNAVTGLFYLAGLYEAIGDPEEGLLILPRPE